MSDAVAMRQADHVGTDISGRGKHYLRSAQTLLRAAQTTTDKAIAARLRVLAVDLQQRAEKVSRDDFAKAMARSTTKSNGLDDPEVGQDQSSRLAFD
jgi:hypothetical protein